MNNSAVKTTSQILKDNICTIFNLLNVLIALSLAAVGAWKNILFIAVILINTIIGIAQEIKAKKQIEKLTILSLPKVVVMRKNTRMIISPEEIQKGDLLSLESGSVICADCVIQSGSIEVNESILTGEFEPVLKTSGDTLLSGSDVISGKCSAMVICENEDNFTSKMVKEAKEAKQSNSELLMSMKKVTKFTGFFIIPLGILLFMQGFFLRGMTLENAVVSVSAGLLGMLPKGLVLLISIGLAAGVIKLSKKKVLVRELHSLENLAHCDILCLDKTGTLTEGKLTVEKVIPRINQSDFEKLISTYLNYTQDNNSTYEALKNHFRKGDYFPCTSTVPFSSDRKYSAVTLESGQTLVIGAPEKLCSNIPDDIIKAQNDGKRVIFVGLCSGSVCPENTIAAGVIIISDKIRKNAEKTIKYFYSQQVDVKIISGDNPQSAAAICKRAGIANSELCVDMSKVSENEIEDVANKYTVFGRVTPKQKKLLIAAMQKHGHKVAMAGDGVNDLLAMRKADCSAAMGNGSDAARQAAQLVLLDSDFAVLKDVISEGRRVINNLTKSAGVFFIKTIYSILLCLLCLVLNVDFPFIPIQITLIDAVIEAFPAFFMSFEKNDKKVEGSFLNTAVCSALPNSIAIFICCAAIIAAEKFYGLDSAQGTLIMYITVGFVSLIGVAKASMPFNAFRALLTIASAFGFIFAVALFPKFLQLSAIAVSPAFVFAILSCAVISALSIFLCSKIIHHANKS